MGLTEAFSGREGARRRPAAAAELSLVSVNQLETINPTQPTTQPLPDIRARKERKSRSVSVKKEGQGQRGRL
nr:MAG TPA: hypothetical protein [Caudoviricetes sp.]